MFQFTKECLIGVESIDKEHEKLFAMINEGMVLLAQNGDAAFIAEKNLVAALTKYAREHFANEEAYMEEIGDKELPRQKKEHLAFSEYVNNYND